jgi:hypothetical protein
MRLHWTYWMWTTGTYTVSHMIPLDYAKQYLVTGQLTQRDGSSYSHVYISTLCRYGGDVARCGIRDYSGDVNLGIVEALQGWDSVTVKLRSTGGRSRAEGAIYEL